MNWFSDLFHLGGVLEQFSAEIHHPQFWVNLSKIIWINVLLSGDNALVVALACRGLAPRQRLWGMVLGSAAAVVLMAGMPTLSTITSVSFFSPHSLMYWLLNHLS